MLKCDFHIHTSEDPLDWPILKYDAYQLIDKAKEKGFDVLAITLHEKVFYPKQIIEYANKKGILLIPGMEATVEGKHVVVLNIPPSTENPSTFAELKKLKQKGAFTIAAHPYFMTNKCLQDDLEKHIDLFDAIEYSHFYTRYVNRNKKAIEIAEKHNKPVIGNSDAHRIVQIGNNYTLIDGKKEAKDVFNAIKKGKTKIITRPLSIYEFAKVVFWFFYNKIDPGLVINKIRYKIKKEN